tara:strand:- start:4417 stop:5412 length:996 start_codon:yes stop_codon:yes gene_type:complete
MAKHIIIDSIARSGTTLLSALLRSQEKTVSFCPGFNEPLALKGIEESMWPHKICRKNFIKHKPINLEKYKSDSIGYIFDYNQRYGIGEDEWRSIIIEAESESDIRKNLEKSFNDADFFCYRWNQSSFYFNQWVDRGPDYLWVSMIRNPMDRACSSFQKHKWNLDDSLNNTKRFARKMEKIKNHKQFHLISYEDLISQPEIEIKKLYSFFGHDLENINLENIIGSNGNKFKPQASAIKDVYSKEDGYLSASKEFSGFYKTQTGRYQTDMWAHPDPPKIQFFRFFGNKNYQIFKKSLSKFDFYSKYFESGCEPKPMEDENIKDIPLKYPEDVE